MTPPKDLYTDREFRALGPRIKLFPRGSSPPDAQTAAIMYVNEHGGYPYTGIHKELDWSRTAYWERGWHLVNRTGDYAVILLD